MTVRPRGLVLYQGVPSAVLGTIFLLVDFASPEKPSVVMAVVLAMLGIALLLLAALTCVPLLKLDDRGIYARNVLRRRRWQWGQPICVGLGQSQLLLGRGICISHVVVDDGARRMRVSATSGMSRARLARLLESLESHDVRILPEVEPRHFPRRDVDLRAMMAESAREWREEQETYRRLEEHRKRRA